MVSSASALGPCCPVLTFVTVVPSPCTMVTELPFAFATYARLVNGFTATAMGEFPTTVDMVALLAPLRHGDGVAGCIVTKTVLL